MQAGKAWQDAEPGVALCRTSVHGESKIGRFCSNVVSLRASSVPSGLLTPSHTICHWATRAWEGTALPPGS